MIIEKTRKQLLNDGWKIDTDYDDIGCTSGYPEAPTESAADISVPSIIQESFPGYYGTAWYWNRFDSMLVPKKSDRVFVRFGAVDYKAIAYLEQERIHKALVQLTQKQRRRLELFFFSG